MTHREWAGEVRGPGGSCLVLVPREEPKGERVPAQSQTQYSAAVMGERNVESMQWFLGKSAELPVTVRVI